MASSFPLNNLFWNLLEQNLEQELSAALPIAGWSWGWTKGYGAWMQQALEDTGGQGCWQLEGPGAETLALADPGPGQWEAVLVSCLSGQHRGRTNRKKQPFQATAQPQRATGPWPGDPVAELGLPVGGEGKSGRGGNTASSWATHWAKEQE